MRLLVARRRRTVVLLVLPGTALLLGVSAACSAGGSSAPAPATTAKAPASPTAAATYNPLAGPVETAAQLPKSCDAILTDADLTAAFGSPQVGDSSYGNYAPLPTIGRTGRVTCGFDISIDQSGHPGQAGLTVSVITYNTTANATSRVAGDVNDTEAKGATGQPALVNGHPATILYEPATPAASPAASASKSAPANPSPSANTAAAGGVSELLMSDGNRTFVIDIPMTKVPANSAAPVLAHVMALVYQHTLPPTAAPTPSKPASASAKPTASPKPSAK